MHIVQEIGTTRSVNPGRASAAYTEWCESIMIFAEAVVFSKIWFYVLMYAVVLWIAAQHVMYLYFPGGLWYTTGINL